MLSPFDQFISAWIMVSTKLFLSYIDGEVSGLGQYVQSAKVYPTGFICQARHKDCAS